MEVGRKNFKEVLPLVSASIDRADFLAIDTELTGLINGRDATIFDTPEEYYLALSQGCSEFLLIQFGLCAFSWDEENKNYVNEAYNFYLFPRGKPGPERMFLCQSSSLDFLSAQGFDFNKLIREGISYMTEPTETKLRESLTERQKLYTKEKDAIVIPDEHKPFIEDTCKTVRQFIDNKKEDEIEIDKCNAFVRLLLFQELRARFKDEVLVETKVLENKNRVLKVKRVKSQDDLKDHDTARIEKEWEEFEDAVGFSKVARLISQSEKLVVGHNMLLDVLHMLNNFFQPLPEDYKSFKEFTHCMFPRLLDTKYMSSLPPFKDKVNSNVLHHLLSTLSEPPFSLPKVESKEGRGYTHSDDKHHEAGYDAYITGLCFLSMFNHLDSERCVAKSEKLKPYINKLFLSKTAHQDSPCMNLTGDEVTPPRDHVFHLTFPKEWTRGDINQLFSPYGQVTVQFLTDTTALVALSRRDQSRTVARALTRHKQIALVPYGVYKAGTKRQKVTAPSTPKPINELLLTPEPIYRKVTPTSVINTPRLAPRHSPEKVARARSNSATSAPAQPTRKRTSSGVFQVEEAEPPPKKPELVRSNSDGNRKRPEAVNGRNSAEREDESGEPETVKEMKVVDKFDSVAISKCVTAFKESDSWD